MDSRTIFRKSEKGTEAIGSRAHGVTGKLRMLLILVDGKKDVEELVRLAGELGESADLLQELQTQGLIEALASDAPVGASLPQLKVIASRLLVAQLGPLADELRMKIETSTDVAEFIDTVRRAYSVLRDVKGQAVADQFGGEIEARMK